MNVLVLVAHPDDEAIGCSGYIHKLSQEGHSIIVCLTNGVSSRDSLSNTLDPSPRLSSCRRAASHLGITTVDILDYPDNQLDTIPLYANMSTNFLLNIL